MAGTTYKVLSFDCYGTLIDWESGLLAALGPWRERTGVGASDEELFAAFARIEEPLQAERPTMLYRDLLGAVALGIGEAYGAPMSEAEVASFGASVPDWPAFLDSAEALARLERRARLVILSNVDRRGFQGSNLRLGTAFHAVLTAEDIGSYKPSPRNFAYLLGYLKAQGIEARELLHVAQSLRHDHAPAKAIGLTTCWIDRRHGKAGAGATGVPPCSVTPDLRFTSLRAFAYAVDAGKVPGL
ncbi:MAG: HAD family hydrolase [Alphaproteobacteria bacterium]